MVRQRAFNLKTKRKFGRFCQSSRACEVAVHVYYDVYATFAASNDNPVIYFWHCWSCRLGCVWMHRAARWQIFNPKLLIWVHFGWSCIWRCRYTYYVAIWSISQLLGIFCGHLVYCMILWFFPFWYVVPRKIWQPWSGIETKAFQSDSFSHRPLSTQARPSNQSH
jgi:hypothetical protein